MFCFFVLCQKKLTIAMQAKARMQINLMLSKVDDIKQVVGIREMAFPLFWFESVSRNLENWMENLVSIFS